MRAPAPAPASTTTSTPCAPRRSATSGTIATRRSPVAVSLGTPSFIGVIFEATTRACERSGSLAARPGDARPGELRGQAELLSATRSFSPVADAELLVDGARVLLDRVPRKVELR